MIQHGENSFQKHPNKANINVIDCSEHRFSYMHTKAFTLTQLLNSSINRFISSSIK